MCFYCIFNDVHWWKWLSFHKKVEIPVAVRRLTVKADSRCFQLVLVIKGAHAAPAYVSTETTYILINLILTISGTRVYEL